MTRLSRGAAPRWAQTLRDLLRLARSAAAVLICLALLTSVVAVLDPAASASAAAYGYDVTTHNAHAHTEGAPTTRAARIAMGHDARERDRLEQEFVATETGGSAVDDVIAQTAAGSGNITSSTTLTTDEALQAGEQWVGPDYTEVGKPGSGVFQSADGLRQFRIDPTSIEGEHAAGVPHVHLELLGPGGRPIVNNHIPFVDGP